MLVADRESLLVSHVAGDIEGTLTTGGFAGVPLEQLLGPALARRLEAITVPSGFLGRIEALDGRIFDVSAHVAKDRVIVELEPASERIETAVGMLANLETWAGEFERSTSMPVLLQGAAAAFRALTGYDRVMIYRFLEDGAGAVLAEDRREGLHSFLNHHFPGTDIPRQARALYVRNLVRVIPDSNYRAAPLRPSWTETEPLDMSDATLRSVSPVHLQYLQNMEVGASASVSLVKDGQLWGLIACHNETPRTIPYEVRAACRSLAGALSRQIKAKEEAEGYRERIRLRSFEDEVVELLSREGTLEEAVANHIDEIRRTLGGDGIAILKGRDLLTSGACPSEALVREIADFVMPRAVEIVYTTESLGRQFPPAAAEAEVASGLLAITLSTEEPWVVLWFRAERVEVINWAGNPHKTNETGADGLLTPRASFAAWTETVRGQSRRWTLAEAEAAGRLRHAVLEVWQGRRLRELNRQLFATLHEKDLLIQQKQFLIGEVNHRVQNSLTLVSSFLALQAREAEDISVTRSLDEARRRLGAVALVHKRLYRADSVEVVDAAHYLSELSMDLLSSMDGDWSEQITLDLSPVIVATDRIVSVGLIFTELVINIAKYAYNGAPGPVNVLLHSTGDGMKLVVSDSGVGKVGKRQGFGTRMMRALVAQLGGTLDYEANAPGVRAVLAVPDRPAA